MKSLNLQEIFSRSINLIINNFSTIAPFILIFIALRVLQSWYGMTYPSEGLKPIPLLIDLFSNSVVCYIFTKTVLRLAENKPTSLSNLDLNLWEGIRFSVIGTLTFFLIIFGFILFIIPGIYFSLKYFFVQIILLDKNLSIQEAWNQGSKITEGQKLKILPLLIINLIFVFVFAFLSIKFKVVGQFE